jgi:hypothetical protein
MQYQGDVAVGWVLSNDRGFGVRSWSEKVGEDAKYEYFKVQGMNALIRDTYVVAGGVKLYTVEPPDGVGASNFALTAAIQHHDYSNYGDRNGWEVQLLWAPSGGFGALLEAHSGVPFGNARFTVGGQVGFLPVDTSKVTSPTVIEIPRQYVIALEMGWNFGN